MNKARKPLSFLLALVMVLSVLPMSALAAVTPTFTSSVTLKAENIDDTTKTASVVYQCKETTAYKITVKTSTKAPDAAPAISGITYGDSGTVTMWSGVTTTLADNQGYEYYATLRYDENYTMALSNVDTGTTVTVTRINSSSSASSSNGAYGFAVANVSGMYILAPTYGAAGTGSVYLLKLVPDASYADVTGSPVGTTAKGNIYYLDPTEQYVIAAKAAAGSTANATLTAVTQISSTGGTAAIEGYDGDKGETAVSPRYYRFTVPSTAPATAFYAFQLNQTLKAGESGNPAITAVSANGGADAWTNKQTGAYVKDALGGTDYIVPLTRGTTYLITVTPGFKKVSGNSASLKITPVADLKLTATKTSDSYTPSVAAYNDNDGKFQYFTDTWFQFTPAKPGWYTFTSNEDGVLTQLSAAATPSATIKPGTSDAWAANLNLDGASQTVGASGWFYGDGQTTYYFKFKPNADPLKVGKVVTVNPIRPTITVKNAAFKTLEPGKTVEMPLAKGAVNYVSFTPNSNVAVANIDVSSKGSLASSTPTVYYVDNSNVLQTETTTLNANTTYYLALTSSNIDTGAATAATLGVDASMVTVNVTTVVPGTAAGTTADVIVTGPDGKRVPAVSGSYPLLYGAEYTVTASKSGYFTETRSIVAGTVSTVTLTLVPRPMKAAEAATPASKKVTANGYAVTAADPVKDADGNIIVKTTITGKNVKKVGSPDNQYNIGIMLPYDANDKITRYKYGTNTYAPGGGTAVPVVDATAALLIDAFPGNSTTPVKNAWIEVTYQKGLCVVYTLDLSSVTKYTGGAAGEPDYAVAPIQNVADVSSVWGSVTTTTGAYTGDKQDAQTFVNNMTFEGSALTADAAGLLNNNKSSVTSAQNVLKNYFPRSGTLPSETAISYRDFVFLNGTFKTITDKSTDAEKQAVLDTLTRVEVIPQVKVTMKEFKANAVSQKRDPHITFDLDVYNRLVVIGKTSGGSYPAANAIVTDKNASTGSAKTKAELATAWTALGVPTTYAKINAIQIGRDSKATVSGPVKVTLGSQIQNVFTAWNGDAYSTFFVQHTKNGVTYEYELASDFSFVAPTGLSTSGSSTFTVSQTSQNDAAKIVRDCGGGMTATIRYASLKQAIEDAQDGEQVIVLAGGNSQSETVTATNNSLNTLVVTTAGGAGGALTPTVVINSKTLEKSGDKTQAMYYGKATSSSNTTNKAGTITINTAASPAAGGSVSTSPAKGTAGGSVTYTAKANTGYNFSYVTVVNDTTRATVGTYYTTTGTFTMPTDGSSVTVTAYFTGDLLTLSSGTGGVLTADPNSPTVGQSVKITATALPGYKLSSITAKNTASGATVSMTGSGSTRTFTMVSGGVTVTANWVSGGVYIASGAYGGTVTASDVDASAGTTVTLTAAPISGYELSSLTVRTTADNPVNTWKAAGNVYAFTMPASGVIVTPAWRAASSALPYTDVSASAAWARPYVQTCYTRNLMSGQTASSFGGQNNINRGSVWTILARIDGFYPQNGAVNWWSEAQNWAMQKFVPGTTGAISDGTGGGNNITRQDLATMLWRYAGSPSTTGSLNAFSDRSGVADYARTAMQWCVEKGIMGGDNGRLKPTAYATRYEVAKMISTFCDVTGK